MTCLFNNGLSHPMCKVSLILSWKDMEAVSRIEKQSSEHNALHVFDTLHDVLENMQILIGW